MADTSNNVGEKKTDKHTDSEGEGRRQKTFEKCFISFYRLFFFFFVCPLGIKESKKKILCIVCWKPKKKKRNLLKKKNKKTSESCRG